ncbi:MAG: FAD-binding oxidoreductase, partial [Candidatus Staskawiczbacteria bacterium]|nr:FAD-binding oxidoreductase [Candidatus Staskawiczbacteria bacterium]
MILQNWWYTTLLNTKVDACSPLIENISCDVLVVGGGMAGLHAAKYLTEAGRKVVLLERNICGGSSTGKSAGFLTPDSELELGQLVRRYGSEDAKVVWSIASQGVDLIIQNIKKHDIKCDLLKQDSLFVGLGQKGSQEVQEEAYARKKLNLPFTLYHKEELKKINTGREYTLGIQYSDTYGINPLLYAQELKKILLTLGVKIYESTEVTEIKGHTAKTHLGSVTAENIIICIDKMKPSFSRVAKQTYHAQTFLSISEPLEKKDIKDMFPITDVMCWDSKLVYTYYRLTGDNRLLVGGGSALTTFSSMDVTPPKIIERVIGGLKKQFPILNHVEFIQYWPGRIDTTKDLIPIVDFDSQMPHVQYVLGCVGLPWAAFCGDYAARRLLEPEYCHIYCKY